MHEFDRINEQKKYPKKQGNGRYKKSGSNERREYSFDDFLSDVGNDGMQKLFGAVQAKLKTSQPGDPQEQEADRIARQVVNKNPVDFNKMSTEEMIEHFRQNQMKTLGPFPYPEPIRTNKAAPLQKKGEPSETSIPSIPSVTESQIDSLTGTGSPMNRGLKEFFEPRFGVDFSDVRLHTDQKANRLSEAVHARAFTHGKDIAFAQNEYKPETTEGKKLIAHELAHVVQQGDNRQKQIVQRQEDKKNESELLTDSMVAHMTDDEKRAKAWVVDPFLKNYLDAIVTEFGNIWVFIALLAATIALFIIFAGTGLGLALEVGAIAIGIGMSVWEIVKGIMKMIEYNASIKKVKTVRELKESAKILADALAKLSIGTLFLILSIFGARKIGKNIKTNAGNLSKPLWTSWGQAEKVIINGKEYAKIGGRLFTQHAIERMMPSGLSSYGRSFAPQFVEDVILSVKPQTILVNGIQRQVYVSGTVEIITEGKVVITVNPFKY
jgi:hypothetical protein